MYVVEKLDDGQDVNASNLLYQLGCCVKEQRDAYLECRLLKDRDYLLFIENDWTEPFKSISQKQFCVTSYGESAVHFEDCSYEYDRDSYIRASLLAMINQNVPGTKTQKVHPRYQINRTVL